MLGAARIIGRRRPPAAAAVFRRPVARRRASGQATGAGPSTVSGGAREAKPPPTRSILPASIVLSPYTKMALPVIGHASYITITSGFLMTDVLALRVLLIFGYTGLVAFHSLHERPLRIPLSWSCFFVLVNCTMALILARDRFPGSFEPEEEQIYDESFSQLTRGQFRRLMTLAQIETLPAGTVLTVERRACDSLYFVLDGCARMKLNGEHVAMIEPGGFCNTLAYQRGEEGAPSYGTITTQTTVRVVRWPLSDLRKLVGADTELERRFNHVLVTSLMGRLLRSRDGAVVQDYLGAPPRLRLSYTEQHEALFGLAPGGDDVGGAQQWDTAGGGREEGAETKGEREGGAPGEGLAGREDDTGGEDPADGGTDPADGEEETQGEERWRGGRKKKDGKEGVAGGAGVARGKVLGRALTKQQVWEEATARALAHTHPEPYAVPDAILLGLREGSGPASPNEGEADGRDEPGRVTSGSGPAEETEVESEAHAWRKGEGGGAEGAEREGLWRGDGRPRGLEEGRLARQVERSPQRLRGMPDQPAEQQPPTEAQVMEALREVLSRRPSEQPPPQLTETRREEQPPATDSRQ